MGAATQRHRSSAGGLLPFTVAIAVSGILLQMVPKGADFENYVLYFGEVRLDGWVAVLGSRFEPLFGVLVLFATALLNSDVLVFCVLAVAALWTKLWAIATAVRSRSVAIVLAFVYIMRFMPLHEMTQLRIAVALAFVMVAVVARSPRIFWLCLTAGLLTHYSTAALIPLLVMRRAAIRNPDGYRSHEFITWLLLIVSVSAVGLVIDRLLEPMAGLFAVINLYSNAGFGDLEVNLFSLAIVADAIFLLGTLPFFRHSSAVLRFWILVQLLGLLIFVCLKDFPVLAHRFREMFAVFWMFYLSTAMISGPQQRLHAKLFCLVNIPLYGYLNFISDNALFRFL